MDAIGSCNKKQSVGLKIEFRVLKHHEHINTQSVKLFSEMFPFSKKKPKNLKTKTSVVTDL